MNRIAPARRRIPSSKRIRRHALPALLVATVALTAAAPALSGSAAIRDKWKNCDTTKAAIAVKATFADVAALHGPGRYMIKKEIRWDALIGSGRWRAFDTHSTETAWLRIDNVAYDFATSVGDRTTWGTTYLRGWRAHVTFKLIKNRPGPRDKKVDQIDIYPAKGAFRELGSYCDASGVPGIDFGGGPTT